MTPAEALAAWDAALAMPNPRPSEDGAHLDAQRRRDAACRQARAAYYVAMTRPRPA